MACADGNKVARIRWETGMLLGPGPAGWWSLSFQEGDCSRQIRADRNNLVDAADGEQLPWLFRQSANDQLAAVSLAVLCQRYARTEAAAADVIQPGCVNNDAALPGRGQLVSSAVKIVRIAAV